MESYRITIHTIATGNVSNFALINNPSFGVNIHSELNLSVRKQEQNLGNLNENDTTYLEYLREHFHLN